MTGLSASLPAQAATGLTTHGWHAAWTAALDDLELDVAHAEALLRAGHVSEPLPTAEPWSPPPGFGPLPVDLRARAAAILDRQLRAAEELTREMSSNRRQSALTARLDGPTSRERPVFVDTRM